ncbi:MAG: glycosyltransferase family 2 protein [Chitinophagales bacterium]
MQSSVQILLATYNGGKFLREQLDSLFNQTFQDFTVLIRDDGSTDNTLQIIEEYQQKYSAKISILKDDKQNVGVTQNFNLLLEKSTADYIFFCDQDDIWLNEKVEFSLKKIKLLEDKNNRTPCMLYSDMRAIDEEGNIVAESVWHQLKIAPKYFTLNRLLIQNIPHGCTMVINKAMRNLAFPIPKDAILHDHWIALLAETTEKFIAIETPLVLLRNHSENVTRKKTSFTDKLKRFTGNFLSKDEYEYFIKIRVNQAKALLENHQNHLNKLQIETIQHFIQLESTRGFSRKKLFLQYKFFRTTFWHTFKMITRA